MSDSPKRPVERGIHAFYADDPERADALLWGREVDPTTRRGFLKQSGLAAMGAVLGATIPFADRMPAGLIPAALAQSEKPFRIPGKDRGLVLLNDRPLNAEVPAHLLDDDITPAERLFVRNNGLPPEDVKAAAWTLTIDGEAVGASKSFGLGELKRRFKAHTYRLVIECAGNGRAEFEPGTRGNQWTTGAVGCPSFTGVRLKDVLAECDVKNSAVYVGYYGDDRHLSGDATKVPISRGVPMAKAFEDETLLAWNMNGKPLPDLHGFPLRLVCGGWPASTSGKWLKRLAVRDKVHDGPKMTGQSYRVPCKPVAPGTEVADKEMCIIESMPVKSLITSLPSGSVHRGNKPLDIAGHAWAGDLSVDSVHLSIDFGQTWQEVELHAPPNRLAWQRFRGRVNFPMPGYYEVWARATDSQGRSQPMVLPGWNPRGYLNNACHRIAVRVT